MRPLDKLYQLMLEADRKFAATPKSEFARGRALALTEAVALVNTYLEHESTKEEK